MTETLSPSDLAGAAIVERINSGITYVLDCEATFTRTKIDRLEKIDGLRIDVVHVSEKQPMETLDFSDNTSHQIKVWIRSKLPQTEDDRARAISDLMYLKRQLFVRLDNYDTPDRSVRVMECDAEDSTQPGKQPLITVGLFAAFIPMRVEVTRND